MKKNKMIIILFVVCILIIAIISILYKIILANNISKKLSDVQNRKNVYVKSITYYGNVVNNSEEMWRIDNKVLYKSSVDDLYNIHYDMTEIKNKTADYKFYEENEEGDIILISEDIVDNVSDESDIYNDLDNYSSFMEIIKEELKNPFKCSIKNDIVNNIKCYKITLNVLDSNKIVYINKDTGTLVRVIENNGDFTNIVDYTYKFDSVSDKDFDILTNSI